MCRGGGARRFACQSVNLYEYQRRLPHFQPHGAFVFVTWRLGEFDSILSYVEENPVKAGLVTSKELWRWSSASRQAKSPAPPPLDVDLKSRNPRRIGKVPNIALG